MSKPMSNQAPQTFQTRWIRPVRCWTDLLGGGSIHKMPRTKFREKVRSGSIHAIHPHMWGYLYAKTTRKTPYVGQTWIEPGSNRIEPFASLQQLDRVDRTGSYLFGKLLLENVFFRVFSGLHEVGEPGLERVK